MRCCRRNSNEILKIRIVYFEIPAQCIYFTLLIFLLPSCISSFCSIRVLNRKQYRPSSSLLSGLAVALSKALHIFPVSFLLDAVSAREKSGLPFGQQLTIDENTSTCFYCAIRTCGIVF